MELYRITFLAKANDQVITLLDRIERLLNAVPHELVLNNIVTTQRYTILTIDAPQTDSTS